MWLHCIQESIEKTSLKRTSGRGGYNWTTFDFEGNLENGLSKEHDGRNLYAKVTQC